MTQPSSLDAPFSQSSLFFAARSSPFVCLADALVVIISLVIHVFRGKSPRRAALLVNWQRARHRLGEDVEELEDIPAEKHPWGFVILLVAAVLQAAKIIGFKGVFWTKAWAAVYLSSYVVIAVVGFLAPKDWRDSPPESRPSRRSYLNLEELSKVLLWAALGGHFVCCSWILDRIIVGESTQLRSPIWYALGPLIVQTIMSAWFTMMLAALITSVPFLLLVWLAGIVSQIYGGITGNFSRPVRIVLITLFILVIIGWGSLFTYIHLKFIDLLPKLSILEASIFSAFARGSINLLLYIGLFWLIKGFLARLAMWIALLRRFNRLANSHGYLVVFACWNFVQALLYYRLRYDSTGTIKPSWTDNLG